MKGEISTVLQLTLCECIFEEMFISVLSMWQMKQYKMA